jgi:hypothetical protein
LSRSRIFAVPPRELAERGCCAACPTSLLRGTSESARFLWAAMINEKADDIPAKMAKAAPTRAMP